ncbi:ECF transporter S component [Bacillus massiliigorillae]|uniref:ECF transporter S component n=1 Tax=Bacillus massiliigorillae TaxID=1243664 RepID=UPI0003A58D5D|nr:ECF transporter S component [Bacillus massiliigorillae]
MKDQKLRKFVAIGMFSSIAYVLLLLEFPLPPFPAFLNVDFSDIPALIAAIIFGPVAGIVVELMKNILAYIMTGSEVGVPIGNFANFIAGLAYILPVYYIYKKTSSRKGLVVGLVTGTVVMAVFMAIMNYLIILPAYTFFMNWDMGDAKTLVTTAILPFNLIKGVMMTAIFILLFSRLQGWLTKLVPAKS